MSNTFSILVVDDDEASRVMMVEALRRSGYQLRGADSAEAALALLARAPVDLVVTDVRMGGMSGIELVRKITERYPDILVIVVTAFGNSTVTIDAIRSGAFDFILTGCGRGSPTPSRSGGFSARRKPWNRWTRSRATPTSSSDNPAA